MHHYVLYNIDTSFIEKYLKSRVLTKKRFCKIIEFDIVLLERIIDGERPLRFFAFYKFSNLLNINPEDVITDKEVLAEYNEYMREYASELVMPERFRDYLTKRNMILSQEFERNSDLLN